MKFQNCLIIGSYGASNIGDEAMLEVMLKELSQKTVFVLSGNPEDTKKRHRIINVAPHFPFGIRSFFSFSWIKSFQFLKKADLVLLGGGGLFTDDYTVRAVMLWAWHVLWCVIFRKKVVLFANSVGPLKTSVGKTVARWAIGNCERIIVRDEISATFVRQLLPDRMVFVGADLVFRTQNLVPLSGIRTQNQDRKRVALNLRDWNMDFSVFSDFVDFCLSQGYEVVLVPTETADEKLLRPLLRDGVMIVIPKDFGEMVQILSTCEKAVGMRLHFLIAAALAGCKIFGIAYSSKVRGVLESLDLPFVGTSNLVETLQCNISTAREAKHLDVQREKAQGMFEIL